MRNFADRLMDKLDEVDRNPSMPGLDPRIEDIPEFIKQEARDKHNVSNLTFSSEDILHDKFREIRRRQFKATAHALYEFGRRIIDATCDLVAIYKFQLGSYIKYGGPGIDTLNDLIAYARLKNRLTIIDSKTTDIGDSAQLYADGYLGTAELADGTSVSSFNADAITVDTYPGSDGIRPFIEVCNRFGKGVFILVKTSNISGGELQDLKLDEMHGKDRRVYEQVALHADLQSRGVIGSRGYSSIGVVVGANYPEQARRVRKLVPYSFILAPGYGAQGGTAQDLIEFFNKDGYGALVNNSRALIFAYKDPSYRKRFNERQFDEAAREATESMTKDIFHALDQRGRLSV